MDGLQVTLRQRCCLIQFAQACQFKCIEMKSVRGINLTVLVTTSDFKKDFHPQAFRYKLVNSSS